ncbi:MFS transporter [Pseudonocardia humida]|uniref:MFS transporter n=1 Tax=Pseudonocardia humida TaxID=2800819 RepID=UPI00207C1724|nr:MFS transporter [Pseudonocardia humida]
MARSESSWRDRGRREGRRGRAEDEPDAPEHPRSRPPQRPQQRTPPLNAEPPAPDPYQPRRRYPWHDDPDYDPSAHRRTPPATTKWVPPVPAARVAPPPPAPPPVREPEEAVPAASAPADTPTGMRVPRKLTVTRVAALRGRELTGKGIAAFRRAATADGADRSGLTALTYATMMTYAVDAAVAVALANTLFFAAATAESKTNVALYLAITVAPFALVAPVIGPMLDRIQRGRRAALAVSFAGRAALALVLALNYDSWLLYPCALGMLVLSKSFVVLKAAVTPRVLPPEITLTITNSRLNAFGLAAGAVGGGLAAGVAFFADSPGALVYTAVLSIAGAWLCLRIPRWVESTAGEVPAALRSTSRKKRPMVSHAVAVALWGNGSIRILTGFLTLFVAFVVKGAGEAEAAAAGLPAPDASQQLLLIGIVGAAAGLGSFVGNAAGARARFARVDGVILSCIGACVAVATLAAVVPGIATAAVVGLVAATASALAKVCLDAVIQRDLPEESRASAFGRSETVLQLAWVFGGVVGVLLPHDTYWLGFTVVAALVAVSGTQTALVTKGKSMLPRRRKAAAPVR